MAALGGNVPMRVPARPVRPAWPQETPALPEPLADHHEFASFAGILGMLWRRRGTLAVCVAAGIAVAAALTLTQPKVYQAKALVEVQALNEDYLNRRQLDPTAEAGNTLMEPFLQTQMRLLQSDTLLWQVAEQTKLSRQPEFAGERGALTKEALLRAIHDRLAVRLLGQARLFEISFESRDPKLAADFVNVLAREFMVQTLDRRVAATRHTAQWLAGELDQLKAGLDRAERDLQEYVTASGLPLDPDKDSIAEARLRQLQAALSAAQEARIAEQSRVQLAQPEAPEAVADTPDSETLRGYRVRLTELNQKLAEAAQVYKPAHYRVRQIQAEIEQVERAYERERAAIVKRLGSGYESARLREQMLRADYDRQSQVVAAQAAKSIRYNTLKREVESHRQLYEATMQKVKEASLASAIRANNVQVVDAAEPPERPVKPSKPLYAALGLGSGGFFGGLLVLFLERHNRWTPGTAPARLGWNAPELGVIPAARVEVPRRIFERRGGGGDLVVRNWMELMTWREAGSAIAEAYRGVLASLLFSGRTMDRPRVIVVASAIAGEGRTTAACNLGIALAEAGRHVLLIDADRRKPRLHDIFDVPAEPGFAELVSQPAAGPPGQPMSLAGAVRATRIAGLFVLPAGGVETRPVSLVDNPRAARLLDLFRTEFDAVVIDTPPGLSHSDARGLARQADGVAVVGGGRSHSTGSTAAMLARLADDGVCVLGTIVNDWGPQGRSGH
jgi:capsular exopolysaccharide synthesis family protein